ncbi:MAG: response regulator transcription factor [Chromatiaceae bacterium]|nr:response regulator transcription factor [Chromatiaceae bacterium]MCF8016034.1 response regulator transcription factor [Chromatiaceae bacterium]
MTEIQPLNLLLCDDHSLFREGLAALLRQHPGWRILAEAANGEEAVRLAAELKPDVVVLDVAMPGMNGIDAAAAIRNETPQTRIVALSMYADNHYLQRMLKAGANAYVLKNEASAELVEAIETVMAGGQFISPALTQTGAETRHRSADVDRTALTAREREVLRLLAEGQRTKDIAVALSISPKTVETYRGRIMLKLGIDNVAGLVKFAIRAGIATVE